MQCLILFRPSKPHHIIPYRANSEPPEFNPDGSPRFSWDWGAFPQPSPVKANSVPLPEVRDMHRSNSVPPELDSDHHRPTTTIHTTGSETTTHPPETPPTPNSLSIQHFGDGGELTADERNSRRFFVTLGNRTYEFELSICEGLTGSDEIEDTRRFKEGKVSFRRFMKYPAVVHDDNLVVKWDGKYISRQDGSPLMVALVTWRDAALAKPTNASALMEEEPLSSSDEREPDEMQKTTPKKSSSWVRWWRSSRSEAPKTEPARQPEQRPTLAPSASAPADQVRSRPS